MLESNSYLFSHVQTLMDALPHSEKRFLSDGYHTFDELYDLRAALTLALFSKLQEQGVPVVRSRKHWDGNYPFDSQDWFIVTAQLPSGQISFHYPVELWWDRFSRIPEVPTAPEWDGHNTLDVIQRLIDTYA